MEVIAGLVGAIVEGVARIGPGPFAIGMITVAGFVGFDRLTKASVAEREREDRLTERLLDQGERDRQRHYEEREREREDRLVERQGQDRLNVLIAELIKSIEGLKVMIHDLDERLVLAMRLYGEK